MHGLVCTRALLLSSSAKSLTGGSQPSYTISFSFRSEKKEGLLLLLTTAPNDEGEYQLLLGIGLFEGQASLFVCLFFSWFCMQCCSGRSILIMQMMFAQFMYTYAFKQLVFCICKAFLDVFTGHTLCRCIRKVVG